MGRRPKNNVSLTIDPGKYSVRIHVSEDTYTRSLRVQRNYEYHIDRDITRPEFTDVVFQAGLDALEAKYPKPVAVDEKQVA